MRKVFIMMSALLFSGFSLAQSAPVSHGVLPGYKHYQETLTLVPGSSASCQQAFNGVEIKGDFMYREIVNTLQEVAVANLQNPSNNLPPLIVELSAQGDADRTAFAHYYHPSKEVMLKDKKIGLYSVILNICPDRTAQAGVQFYLNKTEEPCLLATPTWNYCR